MPGARRVGPRAGGVSGAGGAVVGEGRPRLRMPGRPRPVSRDYDSALETICCASGPIKPVMWPIVSSGTPAALRAAIR